jgi:hypothetical protein
VASLLLKQTRSAYLIARKHCYEVCQFHRYVRVLCRKVAQPAAAINLSRVDCGNVMVSLGGVCTVRARELDSAHPDT